MLNICINRKLVLLINDNITFGDINKRICKTLNIPPSDYYLLQNGKIVQQNSPINDGSIEVVFRTCGGKGGFGSMLRAIGAQIEKTTNREACRDLSGRRLRDINEEKRLKKWITQQAEREQEASERKQKKLERLCEVPVYKFQDENFDKERSQLTEVVETAVIQGMEMTSGIKRKYPKEVTKQKKKLKLWIDDEIEDLSSDDSAASDTEESIKEPSAGSSENSCDENVLISTDLSESVPQTTDLPENILKVANLSENVLNPTNLPETLANLNEKAEKIPEDESNIENVRN